MQNYLNKTDYFIDLPPVFENLGNDIGQPWRLIQAISNLTTDYNHMAGLTDIGFEQSVKDGFIETNDKLSELYINRSFRTPEAIYSPGLNIYIGAKTLLEKGALIKANAHIGSLCEIRHNAYLRGSVIIGDRCVVGNCTEIKNSILIYHVEAGHFNYIGDSILGSYINLGAGTILANLQFRSYKDKKAENFPPIKLPGSSNFTGDSISKIGAVLGDGVETGCNSVISPGVFLGKESIVYPSCFVPKGIHPPFSKFK